MPTYEYRCKTCGGHLEVVQSFTDDALTVHEECGGELRKVFGSVGIAFKGSGFYKTDSRTKTSTAAGNGKGDSDKASSDSASKPGTSSDSSSSSTAGTPSSGGGSGSGSSTPSPSPSSAPA